ncbi:MAG: histidine--tRNA ligase [Alphaproteobacteria bacterium]|nr:histidine--tRNA ligase [Rickettsiales bacterium]
MNIQNVRGTKDIVGEDADLFNKLCNIATSLAVQYGFKVLNLPIIEQKDLFVHNLGEESDIVSKEIYSFKTKGGDDIALRPEFTAGVVRFFVQNGLYKKQMPQKFFSFGPLFRYDRPQKGRYRQFNQFNFEIFGAGDNYMYESFTLFFINKFLEKVGIKIGDGWKLKLNFLGDEFIRLKYKDALIKSLLSNKNMLSDDSRRRIETNPLRILDSKHPADVKILANIPKISEFYTKEYQQHVDKVLQSITGEQGDFLDKKQFCLPYELDPFLVRGMDYYDGLVFEICAVGNDVAQNSILGGGKYNRLVKNISNGAADVSAIGFAVGIERLMDICKSTIKNNIKPTAIYLACFDKQMCKMLYWSDMLSNISNIVVEVALKDYSSCDQDVKNNLTNADLIEKKNNKAFNDSIKKGNYDFVMCFLIQLFTFLLPDIIFILSYTI